MKNGSNSSKTMIVWAVLILIGLYGFYDRLVSGHLNLNYSSLVPWGLWVAFYIYLIGLSAGAFLLSTLIYVFGIKRFEKIGPLSLFVALVALIGAMFFIWIDLGHLDRAWRLLLTPNLRESVMAWMAWFYTAYFLLLLLELWFVIRRNLVKDATPESVERDKRYVKVLAILGIPLAISFHGGVGALFGVIGARPYWHSGLYPILFLVSALASGGALLMGITAFFSREKGTKEHQELVTVLGRLVLGLLLFDILLEYAEITISLWGAIPSHTAGFKIMLFGPFWWVFWIMHLFLGVAVPLSMLIFRGRSVPWVGAAGLIIAICFISVRLNLVIPGLASPEFEAATRAYIDPRLSTHYFPSLTEWLVVVGVMGICGLIYSFGSRLLPLEPKTVEEG